VTEPTTKTLDVPGASLTYDIRPSDSNTEPVLMLIGSPMGASGFGSLAGHFTDRTVVTYDPRGVERSEKDDPSTESTPDQHADDIHRLITALDAGQVDLFASSGGAVNALALVARHPEQVRTLVAHEPPAAQVVPDCEAALAASRDVHDTYLLDGMGPAMAKFIALVSYKGPIPADYMNQPAPDPAMFGLPTDDDGSRTDALLGQNMVSCTHYQPDFDALHKASTRIVIGAGAESEGELAHRAAVAVAERLGTTPVTFPSGHGGFLGGEYGQTGDPDGFAATLREVLAPTA
jgi:pimeloyl-ACP methyl ester carboxylesterase